MSIHRKQFLIGYQPKKIKTDWETVKIGGNLYLSHCPNLSVEKIKDLNGAEWHLLGLAIQTNKEKKDPLTEIANSFTDNVKELYKSWNGRWILVGNNEIHLDCGGLIGCFYTKKNEQRWISSSLGILQEIGEFSPRPENLKHRSALEWYTLPKTRFEGIYKLLPSQVLDLKTLQPIHRPLPQPIKGLMYDEILERMVEKFKASLLNVSKLNRRMFLPLTGGRDSRLLLAACHYARINVETYTAGRPHISNADLKFPFKLSKASGYRHFFIKMKESVLSKEKEELYDHHTAGNIDDIDKKRFSHRQWDVFEKGDLLFRGGAFEIGRFIYWDYMNSNFNIENIIYGTDVHKTLIREEGNCLGYDPESFHAAALSEWMEWVKQTPTEGLDWRDRYYLEQRVAGWLSSIEQSLDLTDTERFYVVNSFDIMSLLLSIPLEKRRTAEYVIDLIHIMFPDLPQLPFNPPDPTLRRLRKKVTKISRTPLNKLYKKLRERFYLS
ncbi:MAG: hypothetical protein ABJA71_10395 [Ginsengibacter sp.]